MHNKSNGKSKEIFFEVIVFHDGLPRKFLPIIKISIYQNVVNLDADGRSLIITSPRVRVFLDHRQIGIIPKSD